MTAGQLHSSRRTVWVGCPHGIRGRVHSVTHHRSFQSSNKTGIRSAHALPSMSLVDSLSSSSSSLLSQLEMRDTFWVIKTKQNSNSWPLAVQSRYRNLTGGAHSCCRIPVWSSLRIVMSCFPHKLMFWHQMERYSWRAGISLDNISKNWNFSEEKLLIDFGFGRQTLKC